MYFFLPLLHFQHLKHEKQSLNKFYQQKGERKKQF